jgi:hypothetical protein
MNHELIKRKVFDFVQHKRIQKDPILLYKKNKLNPTLIYKEGFAPIRIYETDAISMGVDFEQLGLMLLEIEKESGDSLRVVNASGIEKIELDGLQGKKVKYYGLECKSEIRQNVDIPSTNKKIIFYLTKAGILYRVLRNGDEIPCPFRRGIKLEILHYFIDNQYLKPSEFKDRQGKKYQAKYIRKEIFELGKLIAEKFEGIDSKDFIPDATPGEGYKLGIGFTIKAKH